MHAPVTLEHKSFSFFQDTVRCTLTPSAVDPTSALRMYTHHELRDTVISARLLVCIEIRTVFVLDLAGASHLQEPQEAFRSFQARHVFSSRAKIVCEERDAFRRSLLACLRVLFGNLGLVAIVPWDATRFRSMREAYVRDALAAFGGRLPDAVVEAECLPMWCRLQRPPAVDRGRPESPDEELRRLEIPRSDECHAACWSFAGPRLIEPPRAVDEEAITQ